MPGPLQSITAYEQQCRERDEQRGQGQPVGLEVLHGDEYDVDALRAEKRAYDDRLNDLSWAGNRLNLAALIRDMDDRGELTSWRASDFACLLEQPYKWQKEYERMQRSSDAA